MLLYRLPSSEWEEVVVDDIWTTKHAKFIALLMHPTSVQINLICDYLMRKREKWILTHLVYCIQWRNSLHNRNSLPAIRRAVIHNWSEVHVGMRAQSEHCKLINHVLLPRLSLLYLVNDSQVNFDVYDDIYSAQIYSCWWPTNLICVARSFLPLKPCQRCHICGGGCEDQWRNNKLSSPFFASDFLVHWTNGVTFVTFSSFSPNSVFVPKLPFKARHP